MLSATVLSATVLSACSSSPPGPVPTFDDEPAEPRPEPIADEDPLGGMPPRTPAPQDTAPSETATAPEPIELRGIVVALSTDRRAALVLDAEGRATLVTLAGGARHARIPPGSTVSVVGDPAPRGVLVARSVTVAEDAPPWEGLPPPHELDDVELADPLLRARDWVLVPEPRAIDARTIVSRREPEVQFPVRAPRGAIRANTEYQALRGVLVDITAIEPHGGTVLWIIRPEDVVRAE